VMFSTIVGQKSIPLTAPFPAIPLKTFQK
jgi:hypothetical protein